MPGRRGGPAEREVRAENYLPNAPTWLITCPDRGIARRPNGVALGELSGAEQVELDSVGDVPDGRLAGPAPGCPRVDAWPLVTVRQAPGSGGNVPECGRRSARCIQGHDRSGSRPSSGAGISCRWPRRVLPLDIRARCRPGRRKRTSAGSRRGARPRRCAASRPPGEAARTRSRR